MGPWTRPETRVGKSASKTPREAVVAEYVAAVSHDKVRAEAMRAPLRSQCKRRGSAFSADDYVKQLPIRQLTTLDRRTRPASGTSSSLQYVNACSAGVCSNSRQEIQSCMCNKTLHRGYCLGCQTKQRAKGKRPRSMPNISHAERLRH